MVFAGVEALIILVLLAALLVGQPAAVPALQTRVAAQSTENAYLRATVQAIPPKPAVFVCPPRATC